LFAALAQAAVVSGPTASAMVSGLTAQAAMASGPTTPAPMVPGALGQMAPVQMMKAAPTLEALASAPVGSPEADLVRAKTASH
jgi:hypothetical protein